MSLALNIFAAVGVFAISFILGGAAVRSYDFICDKVQRRKLKKTLKEEKIDYIYEHLKSLEK